MLESSGETGNPGDRPATTAEARALIRASVLRCATDRRVRMNAVMYWLFLAKTGLRAWEEAPKITWGDVYDLDGPLPHLWTRKENSKNGRRMRIPLNKELVGLLKMHRRCVPAEAGDRVFPKVPNRATFNVDRGNAMIAPDDGTGVLGAHSLRKWLSSQLDATGCSAGVRYKIMRHAGNLTETAYTRTELEAEVAAVNALPDLWPENLPVPQKKVFPTSDLSLTRPDRVDYSVHVTSAATHDSDRPAPRSEQPRRDCAVGVTTLPLSRCAGPVGLDRDSVGHCNAHSSITQPGVLIRHPQNSEIVHGPSLSRDDESACAHRGDGLDRAGECLPRASALLVTGADAYYSAREGRTWRMARPNDSGAGNPADASGQDQAHEIGNRAAAGSVSSPVAVFDMNGAAVLGTKSPRGDPLAGSMRFAASGANPAIATTPTMLTRAEKDELLRKILMLLTAVALGFLFVAAARQAIKPIEFASEPPVGRP